MDIITSQEFFRIWIDVVTRREKEMLSIWRNSTEYTNYIKGSNLSVISEVASLLDLRCYPRDYYSVDAILYKDEDLTPKTSNVSTWFRDMRVAFEHENNFKSGLFQEVSHLLLMACDLRVLVSYPNNDIEEDRELKYLHEIILGNRNAKAIAENESFLLIFGYESDFEWKGLVFQMDYWKQIQ